MAIKEFKGFKKDEDTYKCRDDRVDSLGTASTKNSTSVVTDSSDLVESVAVKDIIGWGNKNLLAGFEVGGINRTTGQDESSSTLSRSKGYIPVTPSKTYILSGMTGYAMRVFAYGQGKTYIDSDNTISNTGLYTAPNSVYFIRLQCVNAGVGTNMQFEVGSTATAYEPYHASVDETKANNTVITSNIETGTTYSRAYSIGEHFLNNGVFRTVKVAVASGETITDNNSFVDTVDSNLIKSAIITGTTNQNGNLDIYEGTDRIILQAYCQFGVGNIASLFRSGTNNYRVRITDGQGNAIANSQREITYFYI